MKGTPGRPPGGEGGAPGSLGCPTQTSQARLRGFHIIAISMKLLRWCFDFFGSKDGCLCVCTGEFSGEWQERVLGNTVQSIMAVVLRTTLLCPAVMGDAHRSAPAPRESPGAGTDDRGT